MKGEIGIHSDHPLTARYRRLLLLVTLLLFIVIILLAANQYRDQRAQVLHRLAQNSAIYTIALDGIAKAASDHVMQMKSWSEDYLENPPDYPNNLRKYFTPHLINGELDTFTLDAVPEDFRPLVGQLFWLNGDPRRIDVGKPVLDHALGFFALVRLTHEVTPYFKWSYFFPASRDYFNMYPWESSSDLLEHLGIPTMRNGIHTYYDNEFYLSGTPEHNPQRQSYWTAPYDDAARAGTMITHGAPVYTGDKFHGIVATDVKLATLEQFLVDLPREVGRLLIIDDMGTVLAHSTDLSSDAISKVSDVAPEVPTDQTLFNGLEKPGNPLMVNGNFMVARKTTYAPWILIYLINDKEIMGLLRPRLLPYAVILAVLVATVFIALFLMRREFIRPALELVHYIRDASQYSMIEEPRLPRLWQTWVGVVSRAFSENRDATRKFRESEAFKSAIIEEELACQQEALRQSEKLSAMGELLAGVAHELNNSLAILMGRATLLESKTTDPNVQTEIEKIRTVAERCSSIVRTFLSRAKKKLPESRATSLNDVVTNASDLLGYALHTSGIELETRLAEALPELNIDADQVGQVVINLLVNAQHVLAEQPPPRHISIETGRADGGVYCRVTDKGTGVPVDLRQRIFEPFFSTKGGCEDTAVGLSVSRSIAHGHGGELWLENNEQGAVFVLWLPLDSACGNRESLDNLDGLNDLQAVHVLIVDDDPDVTELLSEILQSAGLETTLVQSGQEAIKWLEEHTCDLILSDIRMPDMDGPALWRALSAQHPDLTHYMAFITGDTHSANIALFLKETGLPWLEKPFTPEQVLALVARMETT